MTKVAVDLQSNNDIPILSNSHLSIVLSFGITQYTLIIICNVGGHAFLFHKRMSSVLSLAVKFIHSTTSPIDPTPAILST